uniref:Uncharacterized protein n=1 Tax=Arundo donax TaxID=35708 RepID=A0A0A9AZH4_ARUDO
MPGTQLRITTRDTAVLASCFLLQQLRFIRGLNCRCHPVATEAGEHLMSGCSR